MVVGFEWNCRPGKHGVKWEETADRVAHDPRHQWVGTGTGDHRVTRTGPHRRRPVRRSIGPDDHPDHRLRFDDDHQMAAPRHHPVVPCLRAPVRAVDPRIRMHVGTMTIRPGPDLQSDDDRSAGPFLAHDHDPRSPDLTAMAENMSAADAPSYALTCEPGIQQKQIK